LKRVLLGAYDGGVLSEVGVEVVLNLAIEIFECKSCASILALIKSIVSMIVLIQTK